MSGGNGLRVAVVGATGNVGTAVLRALHAADDVASIVGIARRLPETQAAPYAHVEWRSIDLAADMDPSEQLVAAFTGADAVIHLAWLIQPNRQRELMRRVNVDGTALVAEAAAQAGVGSLVVASSIGAYSPSRSDEPRDESWPTEGIATSHYSVDKVAQERYLDAFAEQHPQLAVARLRTALVFQGAAGAEIQRLFLGPLFPSRLIGKVQLPALPLPQGIRLQAVHADDAASAYLAAVRSKARGAFNVAADDLISGEELARLASATRAVWVPPSVVRTAMSAAYHARAIPADPGWLDMGMLVPVMDTSRAKSELGWQPTRTAKDSVAELLDGMRQHSGTPSPVLRPGDTSMPTTKPDPAQRPGGSGAGTPHRRSAGADSGASTTNTQSRSARIDWDLLGLYLADHVAAATGGIERIRRMAKTFAPDPHGRALATMAAEFEAERDFYYELMDRFGIPRRRSRESLAWAAEKAGRLKLNGYVLKTSPMTPVLEAEMMRAAVLAKIGAWQTLTAYQGDLRIEPGRLDELIAQAERQIEELSAMHETARRRAFLAGADSPIQTNTDAESATRTGTD